MKFVTINPCTEQEICYYNYFSDNEIDTTINKSHKAFKSWKEISIGNRLKFVNSLANLLRKKKQEMAVLMAQEMGKPVTEGVNELEKCAKLCEYYIENAERFLAPEELKTEYKKSFVCFEPLGPILAIMPWNFPFWQVFRFGISSLVSGNTVLLKHAKNVSGCSLATEKLFLESGFPENVFSSIIADNEQTGKIIDSPMVKGVTITGSIRAGKAVAVRAGAVLKKAVLELGGSDPYIILEDADIEQASTICVNSRVFNSGQTCISAKRFIATESVFKHFTDLVVKKMSEITFDNPLDVNTKYGPLAKPDIREALHRQVVRSINMGAECLIGGKIPTGRGYFYPATVLTKLTKDMPIFYEETFGPVAAIISAKNEEEAISIANDTSFGLGAAIFTQNIGRGLEIGQKSLNAGTCVVNDSVRSDPRFPFGGINESGYGRELSFYGMREFVNIKTVYSQ